MSHTVYANFQALEGTVTVETELTFNLKSRQITIINDSSTKDLNFKFKSEGTFGTVKAAEMISLDFWSNSIIIDGDSVPYRIWVTG
jgi:hypothetical protein